MLCEVVFSAKTLKYFSFFVLSLCDYLHKSSKHIVEKKKFGKNLEKVCLTIMKMALKNKAYFQRLAHGWVFLQLQLSQREYKSRVYANMKP